MFFLQGMVLGVQTIFLYVIVVDKLKRFVLWVNYCGFKRWFKSEFLAINDKVVAVTVDIPSAELVLDTVIIYVAYTKVMWYQFCLTYMFD